MLQDSLTQDPHPSDLCAVARWGEDLFDTAHLRGDGVLDVRAEPPTRPTSDRAHLCVAPMLPEGEQLAIREGDQLTVCVPEGAQAVLRRPDAEDEAWPPGTQGTLPEGATLHLRTGDFQICLGRGAGVAALRRRAPIDWPALRIGAMSALGHGFGIGAALVTPPALGLDLDGLHGIPPIIRQVEFKPETRPVTKLTLQGPRSRGGPTAPSDDRTPRAAPRARASDRQVALRSGLLATLRSSGLASQAVLSGGLGDGINAALTGLSGPTTAGMGGVGGLATRRSGFGGTGGSIGIGGLPELGGGGGGPVHLGGGRHRTVTLLPGRTILGDGLGKSAVSRVMRQNAARFKHCYERELTRDPNLEGKVSVQFTIVPDGKVARTKIVDSSVQDAPMEACVLRVLSTLRFDKPRGGGVVVVTYPFLFVQN